MKHSDLQQHTPQMLEDFVSRAEAAQKHIESLKFSARCSLLLGYRDALQRDRDLLVATIASDAKKTPRDAAVEVDATIGILAKMVQDSSLADFSDMQRLRWRAPVGVVGLITSFNFPMVVAHWTIAPAWLAGNAVIWKPSEKTPLAARECKRIFDAVCAEHTDTLQVVYGGADLGAALVAHESVDMISATGSVAMGEAIQKTLTGKKNRANPPILELGGNNAVVISDAMTQPHLDFALASILTSFLGSTGQRCTNTRRLIIHETWFDRVKQQLFDVLSGLIQKGELKDPKNIYGYAQLIDEDAYARMDQAKARVKTEGGTILLGGENEPALAVMPQHSACMHHETFAPLLYFVPYAGGVEQAMQLVNAPENAGLVNGIYTLSQNEADVFARLNQAGHGVVNSPKGTGTPAFCMGFGGNKHSGVGEILWSQDPLAAFTRPNTTRRIAINKTIALT